MRLTAINAASSPAPAGGYSLAIQLEAFERLLFISGQIPEDPAGAVPAGFEAQAKLVWENLCAQLGAAGMSIENLVQVTTYLSLREHAEANGRIRRDVLGGHAPALTVVIAGIYDERWLLEIEAIAAA